MSQYNAFDFNMLKANLNEANLPFSFQHPIVNNPLDQKKPIPNYAHDMCNSSASMLNNVFAGFNLPPITAPTDMAFSSLFTMPKQLEKETNQANSAFIIREKVDKTTNVTSPLPPLPPLLLHEEYEEALDDSSMHIVSPEAIREAMQEEKEEAMGHSQRRPFSQFASLDALKQRESSTKLLPLSLILKQPPALLVPLPPLPQIPIDSINQDLNTSSVPKDNGRKEKLKRPPNAYLLFNRDMRRRLLEISPKMTVAEISKEIGDSWKVLPNDQRNRYVQEASLLKQEHLKKHPDFIYTRRSKAELAQAKRILKTVPAIPESNPTKKRARRSFLNGQKDPRGRKKKRNKHPFAPKHPMSAYLHYLASVYPQVSTDFPGSTVGPISKRISKTWHAMSAEERQPWKQKAELDKARYAQEMRLYMARHGVDKSKEKQSQTSEDDGEEEEEEEEESGFLRSCTVSRMP